MTEADPFYRELGQRLLDHRKKLKLTQAQLGEQLKPPLTRASIANIEAGNQGVLAHTLVQLARALKVSVSDLLPAEPASGNAGLRDKVQEELGEKLGVAPDAVKRLTERLLGRPTTRRNKDERTSRKKRS
jgi:DNA-binding XRE family transcriptional regulator